MASEMIATFEQVIFSKKNILEQPRRSIKEKHMVNKSRKDEMVAAYATPKKVKLIYLVPSNLDKAVILIANISPNFSSTLLLSYNRDVTNRQKTSRN